jgi:hypothetical protein
MMCIGQFDIFASGPFSVIRTVDLISGRKQSWLLAAIGLCNIALHLDVSFPIPGLGNVGTGVRHALLTLAATDALCNLDGIFIP